MYARQTLRQAADAAVGAATTEACVLALYGQLEPPGVSLDALSAACEARPLLARRCGVGLRTGVAKKWRRIAA